MKKFSLLVISFILCCTNVVWADWSLSYKLGADGAWTHNVAPQGDGYVHIDLAANSTYYIYTLIDGNGYASGDATMTFSNSSKFELTSYGEATYTGLKIKTTQAAEYKFTLSYFDEKQHISAVYPAAVYLPGSWNEWTIAEDVKFDANNMFVLHLAAGTYTFKAVNNDGWHGNGGTMDGPKQGWNFDADKDCTLKIATEDDYTFTYSWNNSHPMINVFSSTDVAKSATTGNPNPVMDGITTGGSRWESIQNDDQWWLAKFPEAQMFDNVTITWEGAYGKTYNILGSNNGTEWTTIKEVDEELSGFPHVQSLDLASVATYQYVKFQGIKRGTGYGYSFWEFALKYNNIPVPTNVAVSATGRITFDYEDEADSFEARIYKNNVLIHSQVVENNDVFNFIPTETGTCQVKVVAKVGENTSKESVAYDWSVEAYHVYGKSAYCDYLWETTQNGGWPIYMSWVTDKNGNVTITIEPKGDEGDGITAFRSAEINKFKVGGAAASTYFNVSYSGNVMTLTLIDPTNRPVNGTIISHDGSFCYKTGTHTNAWPNLKLDYAYGTKCVASDAVNPVITTFEKASADLTSITFNVEASDEDDEGVENDVTYKVSGVPGITEQTVTLTDGQFTLTNLTPGVEYTFTLTATDPSGNYSTANVVSTTAFYPPTNIQISVMGRVSFTAATDATSYEARIYDGEDLVGTQVVAIGDMLNFISKESNYDVRLISKKDSYQSLESENYVWNAGANKVYGISNYVVSNQKTDKNEGHNADVFFTWETLKNGDVQISITNAQGEIDADYHFRGDGMNATKFNLNGSAEDFANTFTCDHTSGSAIYTLHLTGATPALGSIISYSGDNVTYSVPGATNAWPNTTFSYTYGTPRYPIETTNPIIASFTGESNDYTTAELTISASDLDDDNLPQSVLTYTLSADNDFVTTQVVPDAQGKVLLEGLKKNAIYHFHIVVSDPSGNTDEEDVEVKMKWDDALNLALLKPITAGGVVDPVENANDGNPSTQWGTYNFIDKHPELTWQEANILTIDMGETYSINRIVVMTGGMSGQSQTAIIEGSIDNSKWTEIVPSQTYAPDKYKESDVVDNSYIFTNLVASIRYIRIRATQDRMFSIKELEVYGTGYAAEDTTKPTIDVLTEVSSTVNTTTIEIQASDLDDNGGAGSISSIKISDVDNGFAEREILNDLVDNQITLTDLKYNTTYNFKVVVMDAASNTTDDSLKVVLPFNTNLDLAFGKVSPDVVAGYSNGADTPEKAVNGQDGNHWGTWNISDYSLNWWQVDLSAVYQVQTIKVTEAGTTNSYRIEASFDNSKWFEVLTAEEPEGQTEVIHSNLDRAMRYLRVVATQDKMITLRHFKVYASGFASIDTTDPVITTFENTAVTATTATFHVVASDVNDAEEPQDLTYTVSGDHGFVTTNVTLDASGNFVIEDLHKNYIYHFSLTATDKAGNNVTTEPLAVTLTWDNNYNLSLDGTATEGFFEAGYPSSKAIDGLADTKWNSYGVDKSAGGYADNWMQVELEDTYDVNKVVISFDNASKDFDILASLDGVNWYVIAAKTLESTAPTTVELLVSAPAKYVRFVDKAQRYVGIYEFEVYATGFTTLVDTKPVVTYAATANILDVTTQLRVDAVDISTRPITTYVVNGVGAEQILTAVDGLITLTTEQSTHYNALVQAKDADGNLSDAVEVEFTTYGSAAGLYMYSGLFGWGSKTQERARFATTEYPGVLKLALTDVGAGDHNFKLYNADIDRCTMGDCGGLSDHYFTLDVKSNVAVYATSEDQFLTTADMLYLSGTLFAEDQPLTWNSEHTVATWEGNLDLSGTKTFTILKKNGTHTYAHDFYATDQVFDGDYDEGVFTVNLLEMTASWSPKTYPITLEQASDNSEILEEYDGKYADVTLNRTFVADGYWYTLCLPFSLTAEQLAAAYGADYDLRYLASSYMKSEDMMYLNFEKATELQAGMPYMFKPAGTSNENYAAKTFEGVVIDNTTSPVQATTYATMTGYYSPMVIDPADYALGSDDYLYHTDGTSSNAFRCYFTLNPPTSAPVRARCVFNDKQVVTNLDEQSSIINQQSKMILDGQLVIIRDGKMYNAQGQIVK